ncbi:Acid phosphatase type 7 [Dermatophagoides farinae]|uniref:Purple acid phosphatase n=1 Tax=Dermatophagoides farinae TaxID=6954 RepID=A0A922L450_DERFA|nr:Acid phosphatase type 7 [Dermatophagoides farinae]
MNKISMITILLAATCCCLSLVHGIEQVHISLGTNATEMIVTWTEPQKHTDIDIDAVVYYGRASSSFDQAAIAKSEYFKDDETKYTTFRALLTGLESDTQYHYKIQLDDKESSIFAFKTLKLDENWLPRFAIYGDLGYVNEQSLPYLKKDVEKNMFDVIFHIGDIAYDLHDENGEVGNNFMRSIESIASKIPYMTCPGNHERHSNFSHYDSRFSMIGDRSQPNHQDSLDKRINNHFHSMEIGPATIIMFSTEYYYYTYYGWEQIERQYRFLEKELIRANENRNKRPWIIVMGHRPLYCLKMGDSSCDHQTMERPEIRQGIRMHDQGERQYGLEDLFHKYGVDIQFYGHEHFYARMFPIYKYQMYKGKQSDNPYDHADGPIHITTGSAGNKEIHPLFNHLKEWVAHHFYDYGYTRLIFENQYRIRLQQVSDDQHGKVLDEIEIIKSSPQPHWMP